MKILIYKDIADLGPVGGPSGYLYNLYNGLEKINENGVKFLDLKRNTKFYKLKNINKKLKNVVKSKLKKVLDKKWIQNLEDIVLNDKNVSSQVNFNEYDYIHFHSTFDMYEVREQLKNTKAKIIITSHSPKPLHLEYFDLLREKGEKDILRFSSLSKIDEFAFNRADYIIFPCEEAEEPYYNQWDKYKEIHEKNKNKYRYILSGIKGCTAKISKEEIRKKYNIPESAFLLSYVGRHNEVKGYDVLKKIGSEVLNNKDIYIIIAGKEGPLYRLENNHWIEVGWTNDPHSIIAASDLFILPNKETYFDLVLLEVLSLGIPTLVSYTGGNKYFEKFEQSGILYFNDELTAINKINNLYNEKNKLNNLGKLNKKIFEDNFNEIIFAQNYIKLIDSLDKEK